MTTSAQIPTLFRADVVIGPYRQVFDKLEFTNRENDEIPMKNLFIFLKKVIDKTRN